VARRKQSEIKDPTVGSLAGCPRSSSGKDQFDQMPLYNAMNFSLAIYDGANSTVYATGLTSLWCPSDGQIIGKGNSIGVYGDSPNLIFAFTSYSCNFGTWYQTERRWMRSACLQSPRSSARFFRAHPALVHSAGE
jgi:hypothetical protein